MKTKISDKFIFSTVRWFFSFMIFFVHDIFCSWFFSFMIFYAKIFICNSRISLRFTPFFIRVFFSNDYNRIVLTISFMNTFYVFKCGKSFPPLYRLICMVFGQLQLLNSVLLIEWIVAKRKEMNRVKKNGEKLLST